MHFFICSLATHEKRDNIHIIHYSCGGQLQGISSRLSRSKIDQLE